MRRVFISGLLLLHTLGAAGAAADSIGRSAQLPGPMEYLEVTGQPLAGGEQREQERRQQELARQLERHGKREQARVLLDHQRRQLERFRLRLDETQSARDGEEAVRQQEQKQAGETS
ncbi:hypothetical protein [Microbulbifer yueqingensis]|nr:hypothetical protein [Microbulbifer yueqingensis]